MTGRTDRDVDVVHPPTQNEESPLNFRPLNPSRNNRPPSGTDTWSPPAPTLDVRDVSHVISYSRATRGSGLVVPRVLGLPLRRPRADARFVSPRDGRARRRAAVAEMARGRTLPRPSSRAPRSPGPSPRPRDVRTTRARGRRRSADRDPATVPVSWVFAGVLLGLALAGASNLVPAPAAVTPTPSPDAHLPGPGPRDVGVRPRPNPRPNSAANRAQAPVVPTCRAAVSPRAPPPPRTLPRPDVGAVVPSAASGANVGGLRSPRARGEFATRGYRRTARCARPAGATSSSPPRLCAGPSRDLSRARGLLAALVVVALVGLVHVAVVVRIPTNPTTRVISNPHRVGAAFAGPSSSSPIQRGQLAAGARPCRDQVRLEETAAAGRHRCVFVWRLRRRHRRLSY